MDTLFVPPDPFSPLSHLVIGEGILMNCTDRLPSPLGFWFGLAQGKALLVNALDSSVLLACITNLIESAVFFTVWG